MTLDTAIEHSRLGRAVRGHLRIRAARYKSHGFGQLDRVGLPWRIPDRERLRSAAVLRRRSDGSDGSEKSEEARDRDETMRAERGWI